MYLQRPSKAITLYTLPADKLKAVNVFAEVGDNEAEYGDVVPVENTEYEFNPDGEPGAGVICSPTIALVAPGQTDGLETMLSDPDGVSIRVNFRESWQPWADRYFT